jgi:hypothetical protein
MKKSMLDFINAEILKQASSLKYTVAAEAPSIEVELFSSPSLVIWSGASDNTIYQDASVNWAFRAVHDALHLETGLGFSHAHEVEVGRIQAARCTSDLMRELVYCETALQALYHEKTGLFVADQVEFTINHLKSLKLL